VAPQSVSHLHRHTVDSVVVYVLWSATAPEPHWKTLKREFCDVLRVPGEILNWFSFGISHPSLFTFLPKIINLRDTWLPYVRNVIISIPIFTQKIYNLLLNQCHTCPMWPPLFPQNITYVAKSVLSVRLSLPRSPCPLLTHVPGQGSILYSLPLSSPCFFARLTRHPDYGGSKHVSSHKSARRKIAETLIFCCYSFHQTYTDRLDCNTQGLHCQ
jgi:hypothetical protein